MSLESLYIDAFKKSVIKGPFAKERKWEFDEEESLLFEDAIYQAYLDAARTFRKVKQERKAFKALAGQIQEYFKHRELVKKFSELHKTWCDAFIESMKKYNYDAKFGQAQKVVNMTFKYLYCCQGAERKKEWFAECHMVLATFTLNWFKRVVLEGNYHAKHIKPNKIEEWSKIDEKNYKWIQKKIKEHFENKGTVIENEFLLWPDEIIISATKELYKIFEKHNEYEYPPHENCDLRKQLNELQNQIDAFLMQLE